MSHKNYNSQQATSQTMPTGLSLSGIVISRVMRRVPKEKPTIEVSTYTVQDIHGTKFYVDEYQPKRDECPEIGDQVCFSVYVKVYNRKNGSPAYTLNIQKDDNDNFRGEPF